MWLHNGVQETCKMKGSKKKRVKTERGSKLICKGDLHLLNFKLKAMFIMRSDLHPTEICIQLFRMSRHRFFT